MCSIYEYYEKYDDIFISSLMDYYFPIKQYDEYIRNLYGDLRANAILNILNCNKSNKVGVLKMYVKNRLGYDEYKRLCVILSLVKPSYCSVLKSSTEKNLDVVNVYCNAKLQDVMKNSDEIHEVNGKIYCSRCIKNINKNIGKTTTRKDTVNNLIKDKQESLIKKYEKTIIKQYNESHIEKKNDVWETFKILSNCI